jgi:protein TonB
VTRSSGSTDLDNTTCRLILERFRFKPSRDPNGRPVPATIVQNHTWVIHQLPRDVAEEEERGR